jgi:phosphonate transport system substrate-binding protein
MRNTWTLVLIAALAACGGESRDDDGERSDARSGGGASGGTLTFSAIPNQDPTQLTPKFRPLADHLSKVLGVKVEFWPSPDYKASVEAFKSGDIQLAWFGGLTGVQARHFVKGARAIAQGVEDPKFHSYFIAHRDTGLEKGDAFPAGAKGMTFTFGSQSSTSGRLMPEHFIRKETGQAPDAFFSSVNFSGDHDKTAELVASGQFQVGALDYTVYDRRVKEKKTDPDVVRVIWQTPDYADYNFTAHPKLEETFGKGFTDRLQKAILDVKDPELLRPFLRTGFIAAKNEDFARIEEIARQLEMIR